jgi:Domain of unknown function (DUF4386)
VTDSTLARLTGAAYAAMIPGGIFGFLYARGVLVHPTDPAGTLASVLAHADLARLSIAATTTVILAQAVAAIGFFALFRRTSPVAASGIMAFGLVNAAAIVAATAAAFTGLHVAELPGDIAARGDIVHALYVFEGKAWDIGGLFFGLWLVPMGFAVRRSGFFHAGGVLGAILVVGGFGYIASPFLALVPAAVERGFNGMVTIPATIGEFWTMGALLLVGVRRTQP